jgi:cell division protein FtsI/penicillin-binding protein 2
MKSTPWIILLLFLALVGCSRKTPEAPRLTVTVPATKAPVGVLTTSVPDVNVTARSYLDAWKADDLEAMYALLTPVSQDAISPEEFTKHYQGIAYEGALSGIDYVILSSLVLSPESAQVNYRVTLHSVLAGDITRDTLMHLSIDKGQWRVQWDDTLVLPELAGGNYLAMERDVPSRANIYDRKGKALVAQTDATAIGLRPGQIDPEQQDALFSTLQRLTGLSAEAIQERYASFPAGSDWYLPLGELPSAEVERRFGDLSGLSGLVLSAFRSRFYFDGGVAPHVIGFVSQIQEGEVDKYRRLGYLQDERIGRQGLEAWGEKYLAGQRGGTLYVFNSQGQPVTRLASQPTRPAQAIYTTLDKDFQEQAQRALEGFKGAIVVLERDTGRVLAMVSSPGFDPNAYEPTNPNGASQREAIYSSPDNPLLNRAAQGLYPLGSVHKIITLAAALESGSFTPESTYECGYHFTELPGLVLNDWTWDHFQLDGKTGPSGTLTLPQGLIRSCNPWFWHIGLSLYQEGKTRTVADMARAFGLGSPTGIEGVDEAAGQVPDPQSEVDATNLAIGQGSLQVTPLQVADFVAAVGNGGTLYRPQVIEKIAPPDGDPSFVFTPTVRSKLPVSAATLKVIQDAMVGVVASTKPRGTAYHIFTGLDIPVAGKTGTAESGSGKPHAWFAGYTFAGRQDKPDIAIAVVVENIGEGSDYAAPIFRRIVEIYFRGSPGKLYPWESTFYTTRTPTPEFQETPYP